MVFVYANLVKKKLIAGKFNCNAIKKKFSELRSCGIMKMCQTNNSTGL